MSECQRHLPCDSDADLKCKGCGKSVQLQSGIPIPLGMRLGVGLFKIECDACGVTASGFVKANVIANWRALNS